MPGTVATRRNIELLTWIRAAAFVALTAIALASMPVFPVVVTAALAVGVGVLALLSPPAAVIAFFAVTATVVGTADITLGVILLLAGVSSTPWLARDGATRFFLVAGPVFLTLGHAEWAPVAVAGFLLGAGEGAGTAAVACLLLEVVGFALGRPMLGAEATGGAASMLRAFTSGPLPSLSAETLFAQFRAFYSPAMLADVMRATNVFMLALQPMVWGVGAAAAGLVGAWFKKRGDRLVGAGVAAAIGTVTVAVGMALAGLLLRSPVSLGPVATTGVVSLVVAEVWLLVWEGFFVRVEVPAPAGAEAAEPAAPTPASPVDALLGQLAVAAHRPGVVTAPSVVLVAEQVPAPPEGAPDPFTEMASIMEAYGARGTSGRGALVAVFDSETAALSAASAAQAAHAASGAAREGTGAGVRMAVVAGDTLLDVYRRPVGGPALAVACAIRAVAGANQVLATAQTVAAAPDTPSSPLGQMALDTSSAPVDLVAIRWAGASAKGAGQPSAKPAAVAVGQTAPPLTSGAGPGAPSA